MRKRYCYTFNCPEPFRPQNTRGCRSVLSEGATADAVNLGGARQEAFLCSNAVALECLFIKSELRSAHSCSARITISIVAHTTTRADQCSPYPVLSSPVPQAPALPLFCTYAFAAENRLFPTRALINLTCHSDSGTTKNHAVSPGIFYLPLVWHYDADITEIHASPSFAVLTACQQQGRASIAVFDVARGTVAPNTWTPPCTARGFRGREQRSHPRPRCRLTHTRSDGGEGCRA